jgi:hypothetical protein
MVEQVLDGDRVAARQPNRREQRAGAIGQLELPLGGELMDHGRGHRLADRADLEQRVRGDRRTAVAVGETEIEHGRKPARSGQSEGQPGQVELAEMVFAVGADGCDRAGESGRALRERRGREPRRQRGAERPGGECAPRDRHRTPPSAAVIKARNGRVKLASDQALQLWPL